jgi:hypothetical protein
MTDLSWLDAHDGAQLFGAHGRHVPVTLQRLRHARVLWLNRRAAAADPVHAAPGGTSEAYEAHLLATCAYAMAEPDNAAWADGFDPADRIVAHADRYGGAGIGLNGGSGRAAVIGAYLVKGVGRTPLVSVRTDAAHASGGAYLEEAVRETMVAEVVRAEFPHAAVPVLAIIDTGLVQHWAHDGKIERRVLVVRPCFVRPAHYVRATAYMSGNPAEGAADSERVLHMFRASERLLGKADFHARYRMLWVRWAEQLAYGFIHRIVHGSNTMSNICFDGKMLDFGATSSVPSWADAATVLARQSFDDLRRLAPQQLRTHAYFFGRYLDAGLADPAALDALRGDIDHAFRTGTVTEMLRLAGIDRATAGAQARAGAHWWPLAHRLIGICQRERLDLIDAVPAGAAPWDIDKVWQSDVPPHLHPLRDALERIVPPGARDLAARRSVLLATGRPGLYRETARRAIFRALDPSAAGREPERERIERFIASGVAANRRDTHCELPDAACAGFAVGDAASYALFRHEDGTLSAVDEGAAGASHAIAGLTPSSLRFVDAERAPFEGAVALSGAYDVEEDHACV